MTETIPFSFGATPQLQTEKYSNFSVATNPELFPFPLNLSIIWRSVISVIILAILVQGIRLRSVIVHYIMSPETKMNATNILFCLDQANGILLAAIIILRISFIMLPFPAGDLTNNSVCRFTSYISNMYLSGTIFWRCCIAIYRALLVKAQLWLTTTIGSKKMLMTMIATGLTLILLHSSIMASLSVDSYTSRLCLRQSSMAADIVNSYKVNL